MVGIVNITADSFSDGGKFFETPRAIEHALRLVEEGADWIDVGGESTRPGAKPVAADEELRRVVPVVDALARLGIAVSVDTMKPLVMRSAIDAGCAMVNDVNGFRAEGAVEAVAGRHVAACVMHMQGEPATMQADPRYGDVVAEVTAYLLERSAVLEKAGLPREAIVLDPGFGFGKNMAHNVALFRALPQLAAHGHPVLAGLSRKRTLGDITGRSVEDRMAASVAAALLAVQNGASLVRVHDVKETVDAIKVWMALR
ncbi:Dihydropteroate synthase [Usitatibacter rugosus]|uniref:Dihydropteroate synthase n=1 Tax=Usitatibacter rugosus TaxID=2732067 RepID=A0A6M4H3D1_9PROT|nr:dihydropteroate synthase [Usitatibacter rugosus]QJR12327.1 Dihydropteroate synthase [Usitatibacter rugosus]